VVGLFIISFYWCRELTLLRVGLLLLLYLCEYFKVKDALAILHLRLANAQPERRIKSRPFSGVDLTGLELIERDT